MAFSIPSTTQAILTGIVFDVWYNTQGLLGPVVIHKEPIQTVISQPTDILYGYGTEQTTNQQITYTPVNQTFSGQLIYPNSPKNQGNSSYFDTKLQLDKNKNYLRGQQDIYDYLFNGQKTLKIDADYQTWNFKGNFQIQNFLNLKFYFFELEATT